MTLLVAIVDCERLHAGWPNQPVNTWSSLAFVVVGLVIVLRAETLAIRVFGSVTALVGVGSVLFHGEHGGFSGWLHDWSIAALLTVLIALSGRHVIRVGILGGVLAALGVVLLLAPQSGELLHAIGAVVFVASEARAWKSYARSAWTISMGLFGAGVLLTALGRTGGPWCDSGSVFQPHAGWHVLVALAIVAYALSREWIRPGSERPR